MSSSWLSFEAQRAEDEPTPAPTLAEANSEDSQKFFATHERFTASNPTGAFDNIMTSFRLMPIPSRWPEIIATLGLLYGAFIGIPVAGAIWAIIKIKHGGYR